MAAILNFLNSSAKNSRLEFQFYRKAAISLSQTQDFRSVRHFELLFWIQSSPRRLANHLCYTLNHVRHLLTELKKTFAEFNIIYVLPGVIQFRINIIKILIRDHFPYAHNRNK